eukprot:NODE_1235_length_1223_cov_167.334753_g1008_i0.p1 GENE.NODE_1235_length_1223_cov_167.334753_g1008_i0~~NODE_1235_length_1223_cov_167.334753_g1008_i0.p1  ORF type:complete len:223 (+),score=48.14 NODE_1235_length_1223_cov_167.334753_g1008_i0:35-703(+)
MGVRVLSLVQFEANKGLTHGHATSSAPYDAAVAGNVATLKKLLDAGANLSAVHEGHSMLWHAANAGQLGVVKLLMIHKADPYQGDSVADWPLCAALEHQGVYREMAEDAKVNVVDGRGRSLLYAAAWNGNVSAVRALLQARADVEAKAQDGDEGKKWSQREDGFTPLLAAAHQGHNGVVRLLAAHKANIACEGYLQQAPLYIPHKTNTGTRLMGTAGWELQV